MVHRHARNPVVSMAVFFIALVHIGSGCTKPTCPEEGDVGSADKAREYEMGRQAMSKGQHVSSDRPERIEITSSFDGSLQPAWFYVPVGGEVGSGQPRPLLVALHTWSGDHTQYLDYGYYTACSERGWVYIFPNFRGPNRTPEACGSPAAVQDVVDAVAFARENANVDSSRIYLVGVSGGGYMSLLMAAKHPELWAGVSAWASITDLAAWHRESVVRGNRYANDIEAACGGKPGDSEAVDREYRERSPLSALAHAAELPVDINAGIHDGYTGSVPVSHSLHAFNVLAEANGFAGKMLSVEAIQAFVEEEAVPGALAAETAVDEAYPRAVLFRRTAGPCRITVFEGGHEILEQTPYAWLERQQKPFDVPTGISGGVRSRTPTTYSLQQNGPNPF